MENLEKTATSWERMGEVYYRKYLITKMKDMPSRIDYSKCHIAASKNGGLIAFVKKSKALFMDKTNPLKDSIRIFYQDGTPLRPIKFGGEKEKEIVLFDFTYDEKLICVLHDGRIYNFDIFTSSYTYKLPGTTFTHDPIIDARLYETGLVCLTKGMSFFMINNLKEPNAALFFNMRQISDVSSITDYLFIPAANSKTGRIELLIPHPKHGVINVQENFTGLNEIKYMRSESLIPFTKISGGDNPGPDDLGRVLNIVISPSNQNIAMFNDVGNMFVFHSTLDQNLFENPRRCSMTKLTIKQAYQFMWCSEDCVIIATNGVVFLVGPEDKLLKFDIAKTHGAGNTSPNMHCICEIDGVRIFSDECVEFLQKVSEELYSSIFPFSMDPAKRLLEGYKLAEERKPSCDEEIRKIRIDLPEAVGKLLIAATALWNFADQVYIIKAAQYGKNSLSKDEFNFNNFVSLCRDLRILNNLRTFEFPRFITFDQYRKLEPKELINRLIKTQNFFLSNEISLFLNLKVRKVYQSWAIAQIKNLSSGLSMKEEIDFYNMIQNKLSEIQGVSYIKLAKKAFKYRKEELGIKFLENEKSILTKIPQYIELRKWDTALELAMETYDSNVIFTVIDKIMISETFDSFKVIVSKQKHADPLVLSYLKKNHDEIVKDYLEAKGNFEELFFYYLDAYFKSSLLDLRRKNIKEAKNCIKTIENMTKDMTAFDVKFYKMYIADIEQSLFLKRDLLNDDLIKQTDISSFDNSVFDVFKSLIKSEKMGVVEQKNKIFELPQRKISILRIRTYAEMNHIDAVLILANNIKSSNLTYLHFAELFIDNKLHDRASECIKRITEDDFFDYKLEMLRYMEKYADALEVVISDRNCDRKRDIVDEILSKAPDLKFKVEELCAKFKTSL